MSGIEITFICFALAVDSLKTLLCTVRFFPQLHLFLLGSPTSCRLFYTPVRADILDTHRHALTHTHTHAFSSNTSLVQVTSKGSPMRQTEASAPPGGGRGGSRPSAQSAPPLNAPAYKSPATPGHGNQNAVLAGARPATLISGTKARRD